ncbi:hypothetical protein EDC04DRAFT_2650727, partial [Pisolithus marmoratus]
MPIYYCLEAGAQKDKKSHAVNSDPRSWDDITVSFEFKEGNGNAERKDRVSLYHILHSDPCRCATFDVTTENIMMRFWFSCRAVTV